MNLSQPNSRRGQSQPANTLSGASPLSFNSLFSGAGSVSGSSSSASASSSSLSKRPQAKSDHPISLRPQAVGSLRDNVSPVGMIGGELPLYLDALIYSLFTASSPFATVDGALRRIAKNHPELAVPLSRVVVQPRDLGENFELSGMRAAVVLGPVGPQMSSKPRVIVAERTAENRWTQFSFNPSTMEFVQFAGVATVQLVDGDTVLYFSKPAIRKTDAVATSDKSMAVNATPKLAKGERESKHHDSSAAASQSVDLVAKESAVILSIAPVSETLLSDATLASEHTRTIAKGLADFYGKPEAANLDPVLTIGTVIAAMPLDKAVGDELLGSIQHCPVNGAGELQSQWLENGTAGSILVRAAPNDSGIREVILIPPNSAAGFQVPPANPAKALSWIPKIILQKDDSIFLCKL